MKSKYEKYIIKWFSTVFNRRDKQCEYLLELVGGDFSAYINLELAIKNLHISYVPTKYEEVAEINERFDKLKKYWFELPLN